MGPLACDVRELPSLCNNSLACAHAVTGLYQRLKSIDALALRQHQIYLRADPDHAKFGAAFHAIALPEIAVDAINGLCPDLHNV